MSQEKKVRILVVDDEESLLAVLSQVLNRDGFDVITARSAEEALEVFQKDPFPLVITDIVMHGMTGIDLLESINKDHPETQVIVMTSYASLDTAIMALRSGAYDYLFKPFEDLTVISAAAARASNSIKLIAENKFLLEKLKRMNSELENRIDERTNELAQINESLKREIETRKVIEIDLTRAKENAVEANLAKSEFLANMTHELRTPLNHIIGFTEVVVEKKFGELNEDQDKYLQNVLKSSQHLLTLITDILDYSKYDTGNLKLERSEFKLVPFLQECISIFREEAFKKNIQISLNAKDSPGIANVDQQKFKQIIYNLLSNALKFTPKNGKIHVTVKEVNVISRPGFRQSDSTSKQIIKKVDQEAVDTTNNLQTGVEVSVSDTGIGLKPDDLNRIFNRFEQIDGSKGRGYTGAGLGLALTKALVELHGGAINAESAGVGKGCTFKLIFPL
jgi:signal transduction histidine kinase